MRVFISLFVFCFCQCHAAPMSGLRLPLTPTATTPNNPKSLSLSFSQKDSIGPRINRIEDINLKSTDTNPFSKEGKKKTNSVSKLLEEIGLIETKTKDCTMIKTENFEDNVVNEKSLPSVQNKLSKMKDTEDKNIGNEKNTINYSIKVLSPPAVFNISPGNHPQAQNQFKPKKNSNNISENPQALYPSKPQVKRKQEAFSKKQNFNYHFNNGGRENTVKPKVQDNINIVASKSTQMLDRESKGIVEKTLNKIESPLEPKYRKSIHGLKDNRNTLKNYNEQTLLLLSNDCEVQTNIFDVSEIDGIADAINVISDEKVNSINALDKEVVECKIMNNNLNKFYSGGHRSNLNYPLSGQLSPNLFLHSNPSAAFNSPTNQVYSSNDRVSPTLSSSVDKLITFFTSKFISVLPNMSEDYPDKRQVSLTPLTNPSCTNLPEKISSSTEIFQTASESIPSGNELEFDEYLHIEQEQTVMKDAVSKESLTKSPAPYLSTITINYLPSVESSNEFVIIV